MRPQRLVRSRRGPGLRARLTLVATGLSAAVSALLLWLGWLLVGGVVAAVPDLPPGSTVMINGVPVAARQLGEALAEAARQRVLQAGSVAFLLAVRSAIRGHLTCGSHDPGLRCAPSGLRSLHFTCPPPSCFRNSSHRTFRRIAA